MIDQAVATKGRVSKPCNPGRSTPRPKTDRERFLRACNSLEVDHPPVWMMRQAGRCLPEYRALKERYTFLQLAQTPELAAEVTLQPIRRFGFDAAIIFSDILVIPEAMGQPYYFRETGGVGMDFRIQSRADVEKLSADQIVEKLSYVAEAIRLVRADLGNETALLGFAGSPWTLASFMLDGGSASEHTAALALFRTDRALFESLCEKITEAVIEFLKMQIAAGVDAVQIFDSHGGLIPTKDFKAASAVWMREIVFTLAGEAPVIVFSKGTRDWISLADIGANVLGIDHGIPLTAARKAIPEGIAVQGNLDPACLVEDTPEMIHGKVRNLRMQMENRPGHIFNLGHGVPPAARLENMEAFVSGVRSDLSTFPTLSETVSILDK